MYNTAISVVVVEVVLVYVSRDLLDVNTYIHVSITNRDWKEWASIIAVRVEQEILKKIDILPTNFPLLTFYLY